MLDVDVIIPALDEEEGLAWLLPRLPDRARAIVVDNGSTDATARVARDHGALVIAEPRPGFGSACWAGLGAATADVVAFLDGDGSLDPADLPLVVDPVVRGDADLVLGRRVARRGAWPPHARVANSVLAAELRWRSRVPLRDLGPMRACRRTDLLDLSMTDRRFGWPLEMVLRAAAAGWRVEEADVPYHPRVGGESKVTGTWRGTVRTVVDMRRVLRHHARAARHASRMDPSGAST